MDVCSKDLLDLFSDIATIMIAVFAAWVGYQQWQSGERQRKSQQSARYFDNYRNVKKALESIETTGSVSREAFGSLRLACDEAEIFLDEEVASFLEKLYKDVCNLRNVVGKEQQEDDLKDSISRQRQSAIKVYRKYSK